MIMPPNVLPAAASAGFTWFMFYYCLSFANLINAYNRKPPALLAADLLAVVNVSSTICKTTLQIRQHHNYLKYCQTPNNLTCKYLKYL